VRDVERVKLLVNIARLYYEHNCNQQTIAEKLGLSRPYVSKLINEAKEAGIVEIKVNDPYETENHLELEIRQKFNMKKVIVIPTSDDRGSNLKKLALTASRYLDSIVKSNDIIGVTWGATLYALAQNIISRDDLKNITVVQLCGGISKIEKNIFASEIPKKISEAYNGTPYILPLPAVVDDVRVKNAILRDKNLSNILNIARKSNIAIFTMGAFGYEGALMRAGYISKEETDELIRKGAVGDICTRFINIYGKICDPELDERTIAIDLVELKKKEYRIGVATGLEKLKCIYASLKGGYPNVLITDDETARNILKM
jgi:deoxyribonucleoside regulator